MSMLDRIENILNQLKKMSMLVLDRIENLLNQFKKASETVLFEDTRAENLPDLYVTSHTGRTQEPISIRSYSIDDSNAAVKDMLLPAPLHISRSPRSQLIDVIPDHPRLLPTPLHQVDTETSFKQQSVAGKPLTQLDIQVLQMLANGSSYPEIAERIHVATITIESHFRVIRKKLEVESDQYAIEKAKDMNIIN